MKEVIIVMRHGLIDSVYTNAGDISVSWYDADDEHPDNVEIMRADLERIESNPEFKNIW